MLEMSVIFKETIFVVISGESVKIERLLR